MTRLIENLEFTAAAGDRCIARVCPRYGIGNPAKNAAKRGGDRGGFVDWISVFGLPAQFRIDLYAGQFGKFATHGQFSPSDTYQGQSLENCTHLGDIRGQKSFVDPAEADYQALRLTCFGRSGSSVMMRYLSKHPQIAVAGRHPYEFTVANHYFHRCRLNSTNRQDFFRDGARPQEPGKQNPWYEYERVHWMGGDTERFFGREQVVREIDHCRRSVDAFYRGVKPGSDDADMYFCEKDGSGLAGFDQFREIWPSARRIFLVRDFRDNCASILAYCRRKGSREFGLQYFAEEEDWVRMLAQKARAQLERYRNRGEESAFLFYEDLIRDEVAALGNLFEALQLDAGDSLVEDIVDRASNPEADETAGQHATSESAALSVGRWRRDLPAHLRALVEEEFSETMAAFGYES